MSDVTLKNIKLGMRVFRGRDWNSGCFWQGCGEGTVIGYSDTRGELCGRNTDKDVHRLERYEFSKQMYTLNELSYETLKAPWKYGKRSEAGERTNVGPAWAIVEWNCQFDSSSHDAQKKWAGVYPIGATGPLPLSWTGRRDSKLGNIGRDRPCFSLSRVKIAR